MELRSAFTKFDKNGDGQLTHEELLEGIQSVPEIKLDVNEIEKAMKVIRDGNDENVDGIAPGPCSRSPFTSTSTSDLSSDRHAGKL